MPLESGTTIAQLDASWPLGGDFILEGDNHIKLIKAILKSQFPGAGGQGFNTAILANETELNYLQGLTGNVQSQINAITGNDNLIAPAGTRMTFYQAAAPVGWTQVSAFASGSMMRVVNTSGGVSGGSDDPTTLNWTHNHDVPPHVLTLAELPNQLDDALQINLGPSTQSDEHTQTSTVARGQPESGSLYTGVPIRALGMNSQAHDHGNTDSKGSNWTPRYANFIVASKD